jgi:hypothetical protein
MQPITGVPTITSALGRSYQPVQFASLAARGAITGSPSKKDGSFVVKGHGALGAKSNGIDPDAEDVAIDLGSIRLTFPAGSFKRSGPDRGGTTAFEFSGVINGASIAARIVSRPDDTFQFQFAGHYVDVGSVSGSIPFGLIIGDNTGHVLL